MIVAYGLFFGWFSIERYESFQMHALDMGNMGQAAWNTIHGHPFRFTNMRLPYGIEAWGTTTRLSFHVEFLFPLMALVYFIYPHPESLLVLQTVALALGAIPVFYLARRVLRSNWLGLVFAAVYLLFPSLEALNLYEFHPVALATPLLLFAFLFAFRRQYLMFALFALAAMGTKEEIGLVVALFGLYIAFVQRDRRVGFGVAIVGVLWTLIAVLVIEPHFRLPGTTTYIHSRYGYLFGRGHGLHGILHTLRHDPGVFFGVLFTWPKLFYLLRLLAPAGFLALLAPILLLVGLPTFIINLFSNDFHMYTGRGDNSAELVAVIVLAAIVGTAVLLGFLRSRLAFPHLRLAFGAYLMVLALVMQHLNGFTPIGNAYQTPVIGPHQRLEQRFVAMIPPSVPVSTQDLLDPALSSRSDLYLFSDTGGGGFPRSHYILLDASAPTYPLPSYQLHDDALGWIHRPGWGIAAASDGLILIERGAHAKRPPPQFYSYIQPHRVEIQHSIHGSAHGLKVLGYSMSEVDLPSHYVPSLALTIYFRPTRRLSTNIQPMIFARQKRKVAACSTAPLGLSWLPTTEWTVGRTYAVSMQPIEFAWGTPGSTRLLLTLASMVTKQPKPSLAGCPATFRRQQGRHWLLTKIDLHF
ncbi:MAG: DUF2079 domain-containing protein [Chloroflexota bacterium]